MLVHCSEDQRCATKPLDTFEPKMSIELHNMGGLIWDLKKRREREPLNQNYNRTLQKKKNPKVLKILKFRGNKIDWDCKIVKGNLEKQENNFAKQFNSKFLDKQANVDKIFL